MSLEKKKKKTGGREPRQAARVVGLASLAKDKYPKSFPLPQHNTGPPFQLFLGPKWVTCARFVGWHRMSPLTTLGRKPYGSIDFWTTNVDAPFHPQPPNAIFHVAGFPRRKFETSAPAPLWVRLCSVVATVPGPRGPQRLSWFLLCPTWTDFAWLPTRSPQWHLAESGNSRYRFGKSFCSTCTISRFHLPTWAWADRLAPCLPLCPSPTTVYLDGSLTLHTSRSGLFCYRNADRAGQVSLLDLETLCTGIQAVSTPNDGLSKSLEMLWHRGMVDQAP